MCHAPATAVVPASRYQRHGLQNFDEASADPQAHLVDGPLKTARSAGSNFYSEDAGNGAPKRPAAAPEARKAIANEWITPDFAGMGI